jgi:hypothetical protein
MLINIHMNTPKNEDFLQWRLNVKTRVFLVSFAALAFSCPAMAYIDPGSGSAIMSAIVGFFVAIAMVIKTYWYKLKSLFTRKNSPSEDKKKE